MSELKMPFGEYKGKPLSQVPLDHLQNQLKYKGLWASTRQAIEKYLNGLMRDPGSYIWTMQGKYQGCYVEDIPYSYLDWCMYRWSDGDWYGEFLPELVKKHLQHLDRLTPVRKSTEVGKRGPLGFFTFPDLEKEGKFFTPTGGYGGEEGKKPSSWYLQSYVDTVTQDLINSNGWEFQAVKGGRWQSMYLPPIGVRRYRQDRFWVTHAKVTNLWGTPQWEVRKGSDPDRTWAYGEALEAIDRIREASTLQDVEDRMAQVKKALLLKDMGGKYILTQAEISGGLVELATEERWKALIQILKPETPLVQEKGASGRNVDKEIDRSMERKARKLRSRYLRKKLRAARTEYSGRTLVRLWGLKGPTEEPLDTGENRQWYPECA